LTVLCKKIIYCLFRISNELLFDVVVETPGILAIRDSLDALGIIRTSSAG
jgi:hypothetical protein